MLVTYCYSKVCFIGFLLIYIVLVVSVEDVQFFPLLSLSCISYSSVWSHHIVNLSLTLYIVILSLTLYIVTPLQCNKICPSGNLLSFYALSTHYNWCGVKGTCRVMPSPYKLIKHNYLHCKSFRQTRMKGYALMKKLQEDKT